MSKTYKIGDKVIDLEKLVAVGDVQDVNSGLLKVPLCFNFNSNVEVFFRDEYYHNNEGDWTEEDSNFWNNTVNEVGKLIENWEKINPPSDT